MKIRTHLFFGMIPVIAVACGTTARDPGPDSLFLRTDLPEFVLEDSPTLVLGGSSAEGASALFEVQGARILPTGEIVVADGSTEEMRFFDFAGVHQRTIGGRGHGPGEFQALNWIGLAGQYLLAWDIQVLRLSVLDLHGHLVNTVRFDLSQAKAIRPILLGALRDGSLLFRDAGERLPDPPLQQWEERDSVTYLLVTPEGNEQVIFHRGLGAEMFVRKGDRTENSVEVLFGRDSKEAVTSDFMFIGSTDSLTLTRINPKTGETISFGFPWASIAVGAEAVEAERRVRTEESEGLFERINRRMTMSEADRQRIMEARGDAVLEVPFRETLPAFGNLLPDAQGNVWISEATSPLAKERRWVLLDQDLSPIGRICLPNAWVILDISPPFILTLEEDPLGVESIVLHGYTPGPGVGRP